jgi:hypothetical protein
MHMKLDYEKNVLLEKGIKALIFTRLYAMEDFINTIKNITIKYIEK